MSSIYLFTGENIFLLRQEKKRWLQEFRKKHGEENCALLYGDHITIRDLLDEVSVMPFLSEKRLVVVELVPKCTREEIQNLLIQIHPQVILVFCDSKPDKRLTGVKELFDSAEVKTFALLKPQELSKWMQSFAAEHGARLDVPAEKMLLEFLGNDMDVLSLEIKKLALRAHGRSITTADIDQMTIPSDEGIVWRMTDLLCAGSRLEALRTARRMLDRGADGYQLWAILLSMLKNVVLVRAALDARITNAKAIADKTGVHIFALRNLQPYAHRVNNSSVRTFLSWAVQSEKDLKTGILKASDDAPQEIHALIDQFIMRAP